VLYKSSFYKCNKEFIFFISGVIALAFSLISFVTGLIALFSPKIKLLIKGGPVKILHMSVGIFALSMGLITIVMGINMDFFSTAEGGLASALMVFVSMILLYIIIQPILDIVATIKSMM
jgi:hypothetical protein